MKPYKNQIQILLLILFFAISGCGRNKDKDNPYVGNMNDLSYSGQVTTNKTIYRINAEGREIPVSKFKGKFVWADYGGPWCEACIFQARALKQIEEDFSDKVVFLTVLTSKSPKYEDIPNQQTASTWANRFGLNPERVVAATNLWAWTIPKNILYSPQGQTLYRSTGYLSEDKIRELLNRYIQDWENWERSGQKTKWMKFDKPVNEY